MWSVRGLSESYLGIILVAYIDGALVNISLGLSLIPSPHTGQRVKDAIEAKLEVSRFQLNTSLLH